MQFHPHNSFPSSTTSIIFGPQVPPSSSPPHPSSSVFKSFRPYIVFSEFHLVPQSCSSTPITSSCVPSSSSVATASCRSSPTWYSCVPGEALIPSSLMDGHYHH
ncbi:hypothetical protein Pmani_000133 [Petrolisthes manimaculis]|uniref:Uncharacterized protein n=1 Tax=Petrolisthes manimaculis TaxID=1843537 RepID=A0AAE1QN19_9EUCA|nr:hypothetical protein Pmani_000133 [Petrolisthes manimaculis]